jgi:hypothetical protein
MNNLRNDLTVAPNSNTFGDPTHDYIDITICNNSQDLNPQPILFSQIKSNNIVDDSSEYYLSCVRWSLDSQIPQIIPEMQLVPVPSVGERVLYTGDTEYILNIGKGSTPNNLTFVASSYERIQFQPEDLTILAPQYQPISIDEYAGDEFFYLNSIDNFLEIVNTSLKACYEAVETTFIPSGDRATNLPPRFVWNDNYNKIDLYISHAFIQEAGSSDNLFITMNTKLFNLFNTFSSANVGSNNSTAESQGRAYALYTRLDYQPFVSITIGTQNINVYVYTQNSSSVPTWCPCQSIEFITHSIPVNPSNTGAPLYIGDNLKTSNNVNAVSNIITDFQIPMTIGTEYTRNLLYYQPTAEYRLFDLISQQSLQNINISVAWLDKFGFSHPMYIKYGASASVKLLLRKKTFNGY